MIKKKEVEKATKTEKKIDKEELTILGKREKKLAKFAALLGAFFASGSAILIFVFGVISVISSINLSNDALLNNNIVTTFVSKMNGYTMLETKDIISVMTNRLTFIVFEIVIPAIAFIGTMLLIIVLAKRVIDFVNDVNFEKDLYTKKKLSSLREIVTILSVILLATLVIFNRPSIIIYLIINALLGIIYLLFKRCVLLEKR